MNFLSNCLDRSYENDNMQIIAVEIGRNSWLRLRRGRGELLNAEQSSVNLETINELVMLKVA